MSNPDEIEFEMDAAVIEKYNHLCLDNIGDELDLGDFEDKSKRTKSKIMVSKAL